jgi:hypothetical protein
MHWYPETTVLCHALLAWNLKDLLSLKPNKPPTNAKTYNIHLQHKLDTHRHSFNTGNMQEKLLFVLNGKCLFLQGVLEHGL